VKLLLIILSILLLSSPLFGKETGVLYLWENGTKYMGEWKDGKKHGQGTFTYGKGKWEGDKYEGEFKVGYRNGQGTYTWSDGEKYVGEWKDGKMWNGTFYDKNGNIKGKVVNGKEIKQ